MSLRPFRAVSIAIAAAILSTLLLACSPPEPASSRASIGVQAGEDADLTVGRDDSIRVHLPGTAIAGAGTLTVERRTDEDRQAPGWRIELSDGARLVGTATLQFTHDFVEGEPAPLIGSINDDGAYKYADDLVVDGNTITVTTTQLSSWFSVYWSDISDALRARFDEIFSRSGVAPTCDDESAASAAGYQASADPSENVYWCLGMPTPGTPRLKVVNGRGFPIAVEYPPGLTVQAGEPSGVAATIASLFHEGPTNAANTTTLLTPGDTIEFDVVGRGSMAVDARPSVVGYLASVAQFGVDAATRMLTYAGQGWMLKDDIANAFDWPTCLASYLDTSTSALQTTSQLKQFLSDAYSTALGCAGDVLGMAGLDQWSAAFSGAVNWLATGVRAAVADSAAAPDTALALNGNQITITAPTKPAPSYSAPSSTAAPPTTSEPPTEIEGWPAELQGTWCASSGDDCFSIEALLQENPEAFVQNSRPDPVTPGMTFYTVCTAEEFDNGCSMAGTIYLEYFPIGVSWDCGAAADQVGLPGCAPDYTADHDLTQPRIVIPENHQHNDQYTDSPPLYRV